MKVVLINPPAPYLIEPHCQCPLGIMYLSAVLRQSGINCQILNLVDKKIEDIDRYLPDPIGVYWWGITSTTLDYPNATHVLEAIKKRDSLAVVILGGSHATAMGEECLKDGWDYVVRGEMEESIVVMHFKITRGIDLPKVYCGGPVDVNRLPYPDRDGIDVLGGDIFIDSKHYDNSGYSTSICFSRGCYNSCAFCSLKSRRLRHITGRGMRYRNATDIRKEIIHCIDRYGVREYRLVDDCFNYLTDKMLAICDAIKDLGIYWRASFTVGRDNNIEVYKALYEAGCRELSFGVESADNAVLRLINKPQTVEDCIEALTNCEKVGIKTRVLMIMGLPGETEATLERNIEFCNAVPHTNVALKKFVPLPGSLIWDYPENYGCRIINNNWRDYNFYLYGKNEHGEVEEIDLVPLIECNTIAPEKQMENLKRMKEFLERRSDIMWHPGFGGANGDAVGIHS